MEIFLMDLQYFHLLEEIMNWLCSEKGTGVCLCVCKNAHVHWLQIASVISLLMYPCLNPGLRGAPGYSLEQAHHLPIEMDTLVGE